jgi:hypothetical protein
LPLPSARIAPIEALNMEDMDRAEAELAPALVMSRRQVGTRMDEALALVRLPLVMGMLQQGQIDETRAKAVMRAMGDHLPPDDPRWARVERRVAARAGERTAAQLRKDVIRAVLAIDPAAAQRQHEKAVQDRFVRTFPMPAGMAGSVAEPPPGT